MHAHGEGGGEGRGLPHHTTPPPETRGSPVSDVALWPLWWLLAASVRKSLVRTVCEGWWWEGRGGGGGVFSVSQQSELASQNSTLGVLNDQFVSLEVEKKGNEEIGGAAIVVVSVVSIVSLGSVWEVRLLTMKSSAQISPQTECVATGTHNTEKALAGSGGLKLTVRCRCC